MGALDWLIPLLMIGIVVLIVIGIARAFGLDRLLAIFAQRQKPVAIKRRDYDAALLRDLKRAARRNRGPQRFLILHDPKDAEHPPIFWGRIRGVTPETDVLHVLVRRRFRVVHELAFIPKDRVSDLHSRDLYAACVGLAVVNRYYWIPVWGATVDARTREDLNAVVDNHLQSQWHRYRAFLAHEEGTSQMIASMESLPQGRRPLAEHEAELEPVRPARGEEELE